MILACVSGNIVFEYILCSLEGEAKVTKTKEGLSSLIKVAEDILPFYYFHKHKNAL